MQDKELEKAGGQEPVPFFGNNTPLPSKTREATKPAGTIDQLFRRMTKIN